MKYDKRINKIFPRYKEVLSCLLIVFVFWKLLGLMESYIDYLFIFAIIFSVMCYVYGNYFYREVKK